MKNAHCTEITRFLPHAKPFYFQILLMSSLIIIGMTNAVHAQPPATEPNVDSQKVDSQTEKTLLDTAEKRSMTLLSKELKDQETVVWLNAIDGEFLSLYEQEWTSNPFGAVLILHAEGQHANWPNTIELIRSSLPQYGWSTLSTSLPDPDLVAIPARKINAISASPKSPETQEQANSEVKINSATEIDTKLKSEKGEDNEIFDEDKGDVDDGSIELKDQTSTPEETEKPRFATEDIANSRIESAIEYLNNQGIYNIVLLGDGVGAARAGNFLGSLPTADPQNPDQKIIKPVRAVVIINARNNSPRGDINLMSSLYDPEVATTDIYFGTHENDIFESHSRKKFASRNGFKVYQQIRLPELSHNTAQGENRLSRRIRGFLQKYAKGVKIDNAIVNRK